MQGPLKDVFSRWKPGDRMERVLRVLYLQVVSQLLCELVAGHTTRAVADVDSISVRKGFILHFCEASSLLSPLHPPPVSSHAKLLFFTL